MSRTQPGASSAQHSVHDVVPYETRLAQDRRWALGEGSDFLAGQGGVRESLLRITARLDELSTPYAVAGGLALFQHGYRRFTDDVNILVSATGPGRMKDLADVQELKALRFPASFADELNAYVRDKYMELWQGANATPGDEAV